MAGVPRRVAIHLPPRHGKSEEISRYFPAWFLGTFPDCRLILASYEADFAGSWGRKARDLLEEYGRPIFDVAVRQDSSARTRWDIDGHSGGMIAAGVGGAITGKGAHCLPGETLVETEAGSVRIDRLANARERPLVAVWSQERARYARVIAAQVTYTNELNEITTDSGHRVRATGNHRFFVPGRGYVEAALLQPGQRLTTLSVEHPLRRLPETEDGPRPPLPLVLSAGPESRSRDHLRILQQAGNQEGPVVETTIVGVERLRTDRIPVYDLQVEGPSNFFADGVLVHNCLIIDDPVKNAQDAQSEVNQRKQWDWYTSTAYTRLEPGGAVILLMTRWHENDLGGQVLAATPEDGVEWEPPRSRRARRPSRP